AGSTVTITAQLADANSVSVGTAGQVVTWSLGSGTGSFGSPTSTTSALGVATVTYTPSATAGATATVVGTDGSSRTGTSPTITSAASAATQLVITQQPSATATAGAAFGTQPVLEIRDASGNKVTSDNATIVTAARLGGSGTLLGTVNKTAVAGVVTYTDLVTNAASSITVQF